MSSAQQITSTLIAPCGMNCGVCSARLIRAGQCPGCRGKEADKPISCRQCIIVHCPDRQKSKLAFCSPKCGKFPCRRLSALDKRYRTKYHMSMIENLKNIEATGIRAFVKKERKRWACAKCDGLICVHKGSCYKCGTEMKSMKLV